MVKILDEATKNEQNFWRKIPNDLIYFPKYTRSSVKMKDMWHHPLIVNLRLAGKRLQF